MIDDNKRGAPADDMGSDTENSPAEPEITDPPKKAKKSFWRELPVLLVIAVAVALLVRTFVLQSFWIPSGSMENTLQLDDYVLANKLVYDFRDPERGEVVVFSAPAGWTQSGQDEDFIKRVIAIGGDTVAYDPKVGHITVNGQPLDESSYLYTNPDTGIQQSPSRNNDKFSVEVPEGRLWVMGDHRWESGDSRQHFVEEGRDVEFATIPVDDVIGKAFVLIWPISRWDWLGVPATFDDVPNP